MKKEVIYNGYDKSFNISKKKRKIKKSVKLALSFVMAVVFILFAIMTFNLSFSFSDSLNLVNYKETGAINYKIYLKENDHYIGSYLEPTSPTNQYISALINTINIEFSYDMVSNQISKFNGTYDVIGELIITSNNEPDQILNQKEYILKDNVSVSNEGSMIIISDDVDIDYDTYNDYVNSFKSEYGLLVDSKLLVKFVSNIDANFEDSDDKFTSNQDLILEIPLSEQTIEINHNDKINDDSYITKTTETEITNLFVFAVSVSCAVLALVFIFFTIKTLLLITAKKDIYTSTIKKYLREYDRLIVTSSQPEINEKSFDNKIRVMTIEELIDAHDSTGQPIIYYEVIENEKSYFIITNGNTLYKLTISRAYLENEKTKK